MTTDIVQLALLIYLVFRWTMWDLWLVHEAGRRAKMAAEDK